MAAAYGYAGDFSSDDDERVEQRQERMVQSKFDNGLARPNKKQIEDEIESIKRQPFDQEINLSDDMLAALLDYYKTQRGPIVDSTRRLYNKIALRLVRGDQSSTPPPSQQVLSEGSASREVTNGNAQKASLVNDNNNSINIISKGLGAQTGAADAFSSDDDEIEVVETDSQKLANRFDSRIVYGNLDTRDDEEDDNRMEVDSETPGGPVRESKQVDLSTTDEDDESSSSSEDSDNLSDSDAELNSGSDAPEVTPIKPPGNREKEAIEVLMAMRPSTPKQAAELSMRSKHQMAHSTPKESVVGTAKKPYTRSQRVATRSATRSTRSSGAAMGRADKESNSATSLTSSDAFLGTRRVSRRSYTLAAGALVVLMLAFLAYYFRSNIMKSAEPMLRRKISF